MTGKDYTIEETKFGVRISFNKDRDDQYAGKPEEERKKIDDENLKNARHARAALLLQGIDPKRLGLSDSSDAKHANEQSYISVEGMKSAEFENMLARWKNVMNGPIHDASRQCDIGGFCDYAQAFMAPLKATPEIRFSESGGNVFRVSFPIEALSTAYSLFGHRLRDELDISNKRSALQHISKSGVKSERYAFEIDTAAGDDILTRISDHLINLSRESRRTNPADRINRTGRDADRGI